MVCKDFQLLQGYQSEDYLKRNCPNDLMLEIEEDWHGDDSLNSASGDHQAYLDLILWERMDPCLGLETLVLILHLDLNIVEKLLLDWLHLLANQEQRPP